MTPKRPKTKKVLPAPVFDASQPDMAALVPLLPAGVHLPSFVQQSLRILDSYASWMNQEIIPRNASIAEQVLALFNSPMVVVSSGNESDPLLNYGNQQALTLWEMTLESFIGTPGRLTAEPPERGARADLLKRVREKGFITDYEGVRVSHGGKRFWISAATVWNILDANGSYLGQAAMFGQWKRL